MEMTHRLALAPTYSSSITCADSSSLSATKIPPDLLWNCSIIIEHNIRHGTYERGTVYNIIAAIEHQSVCLYLAIPMLWVHYVCSV